MKYAAYQDYKPCSIDWLPQAPTHWQIKGLRHVCRFAYGDALAAENREEGEVAVYGSNGQVGTHDSSNTLAPVIVVGRKGSFGKLNYSREPVFAIDTTYFIDKRYCSENLDWLAYALRPLKLDEASKDSAVPGLAREDAYQHKLLVPPIDEQQAIARFLDAKTAQIDTLVAHKQQLIAKLKEKRSTLIARTVTRGLPPEAAMAAGLEPNPEMRDSKMDWLGTVPAHWKTKAIKWESPVQRGASPRPIDDPGYFDDEGEYAWVRISDVTASGMYLNTTEQRLSNLGSSLSVKIQPGSLFLSIAGTVGKPCIANIKCCIHDGFVYFPRWKGDSRFLFYVFASGEPYKGLGKMGTQLNLNTDTVGSIVIGIPDAAEQKLIADYLDKTTMELDSMAAAVETAIERLVEYRQALITSAVTGKIDVRNFSFLTGAKSHAPVALP